MKPLYMLRVEVDGHFRGGPPRKPWAARILGTSAKYGFVREFVEPMNDWKRSRRASSGNVYGVVATFALREKALYEIARCKGKPSKRYVVREFFWVDHGVMSPRTKEEAMAIAESLEAEQ